MDNPHPGVDIVVPFYNEETVLPGLCRQLVSQTDDRGNPLPRGFFRVIAVNNASTDTSAEIIKRYAASKDMPEMILVNEPVKGVVQARKTGSELALRESRQYPFLLHIDADNLLPPDLVFDVCLRLSRTNTDVLAYSGHFAAEFWKRVPNLALRYFRDVGTLEFCDMTKQAFGFDDNSALFTEQIYRDFVRVPNQLGLAVTKEIFERVGGYSREYKEDGSEVLGEARNIWFRLDRADARLTHVRSPFITLNPRRLLYDPVRWCEGRSYDAGMPDLRQVETEQEKNYSLLNRLADRVDFYQIRKNLVKRFIIEPCVGRIERVRQNPAYFNGIFDAVYQRIESWSAANQVEKYVDTFPLVIELSQLYTDKILENIRALRGLS
jgi:glycosyltransferase involved in cell wall biosynthesis